MDVVNVDTDRDDTRATGHMGKSSSVAWTKRIAEECKEKVPYESQLGRHDTGFAFASYHTEDADVEYIDTSAVDAYAWPDDEVADALVRCYFDHVHNALPIIDEANFMFRYTHFIRGSSPYSLEDTIWLGTFNIVFAISAVYTHMTKAKGRGEYFDHMIYYARAKMCIDGDLLYQDARVSTTCALGLLTLYFLTACRVDRYDLFSHANFHNSPTLGLGLLMGWPFDMLLPWGSMFEVRLQISLIWTRSIVFDYGGLYIP